MFCKEKREYCRSDKNHFYIFINSGCILHFGKTIFSVKLFRYQKILPTMKLGFLSIKDNITAYQVPLMTFIEKMTLKINEYNA